MLYHLSRAENISKLIPRIPNVNPFTEDNTIPRVCFSDSIVGCLKSLYISGEYYVYIPVDRVKVIKPTAKQVRDSIITGEVWALNEVEVVCIGKVKSTCLDTYTRINVKKNQSTKVFDHDFEWIARYNIGETDVNT